MNEAIYYVKTQGKPDFFAVSHSHEKGAVAPQVEGTLRYIPGTGLELMMLCWEQYPKVTVLVPDERVCVDSCMEMFICCFPEEPGASYLNVEMNAAGNAKCAFGPDRNNRKTLTELGITNRPVISATVEEAFWQIDCLVPESLLETLYGRPCHFAPGHEMRANFYKCGDETDAPHWATWSPVGRLDFHTPEFFGLLIIV